MTQYLPPANGACLFTGVIREARPLLLHTLATEHAGATSVCLTSYPQRARELAGEIISCAQWQSGGSSPKILHFPEPPSPDIDPARRNDRQCDRLAVLSALLQSDDDTCLLIATPEALFAECPQRSTFECRRLVLSAGDECPFTKLAERLTSEMDYAAEALCEHPGQIATRGGLIDIYPFEAEQPYRLDFFGDTIESIRSFDPHSQRTLDTVETITVSTGMDAGISSKEGNALDYLPPYKVNWLLDDPALLVREHPRRFDSALAGAGKRHCLPITLRERGNSNDRRAGICSIDTEPGLFANAPRMELSTETTEGYRVTPDMAQGKLDSEHSARSRFENRIHDWAKKEKLAPCFVTADDEEGRRIRETLAANPLTAELKCLHLTGNLAGGFIARRPLKWLPFAPPRGAQGVVVITGAEFFGHRRHLPTGRERARPQVSQVDQLLDFTELADGDPLVHLQHGVCLFRGLTRLEIEGGSKEVITVEFAEQMRIHVPLHESHLLTRYVGLTKSAPKLARIGGAAWEKTRRAAERATLDYAAELLSLHAHRDQSGGYAFPADTPWQKQFEDAFPFVETPDQKQAIEATRQDMESPGPMDRLICGDVGFGKTEVAIRAAFKAVLAGKQVALLVPTTVLCQQHTNTFRERMAPYPVLIDTVSRFRSPAQNRKVLRELAEGKLDVVIGTHRLLSGDVQFHDLGLLIVDEEQRFGVRQKEQIKKLRADVDILTLSATPIPRTLYMALAGARSMSVIETPPADRRPIETIVKSYNPELVQSAIQAEVDRGGQVFYLHNRVDSIESVARRLREKHPRLRIAVGHGQMEEKKLEKIMTRFVAGEFDVLVCTTIIESGIDIPNCNTLIIEGADRFGLAQLYQIRGRVGRFKRQAYAYLLLHRHATLMDQAQKRLNALKQHNQLGAGFRIAMRDLELRGAGNLLGAQQSGHIAGVGFELYCQLLKQSVARLKGEPGADRIRAEVKLDFVAAGEGAGASRRTSGSAGFAAIKEAEYDGRTGESVEASLPAEYIDEPRLRIDLYRRLALADDPVGVAALKEEMADRFGPLPPPAEALVAITEIRVLAEAAGVRRVESEGDRLICHLAKTGTSSSGKSGAEQAFLKTGTRFPRLKARKPLKRLAEIRAFLSRHGS
ncbi:MAG: transcription-repair coupling factor [Opitutales bacterium]